MKSEKSIGDEVFEKRENQLGRVHKALEHFDIMTELSIILSWMSVVDVDAMLEILEKDNP